MSNALSKYPSNDFFVDIADNCSESWWISELHAVAASATSQLMRVGVMKVNGGLFSSLVVLMKVPLKIWF